MSALFIVYLLFSLTATWLLLSAPYLRITSLGWFIAIWSLPYVGALFFFLTVVRHRVTGHTEHYRELARYAASIEDGDNHVMSNVQRINNLGKKYGFLPHFLMKQQSMQIKFCQRQNSKKMPLPGLAFLSPWLAACNITDTSLPYFLLLESVFLSGCLMSFLLRACAVRSLQRVKLGLKSRC